jgi:drug/metabolite transporter (DMT)-like permease
VTFARLRPADWVVLVAAVGLLLATVADWYSPGSGEEARTIEDSARQLDIRERAALLAENEELGAWEPVGFADLLVLIGALATAALSVVAAYARAAGRRPERLGATALAGLAATVTALVVLYRVLQEPGYDALTTVQGAPLALALLGAIAFATAVSVRQEEGARAADLQSRR